MPPPLSPPQPPLPGPDLPPALPVGGGAGTLTAVLPSSQPDILGLQQAELTDDTVETLPVVVSLPLPLPSQCQLPAAGLYDGLALPADLAKDPLIAVPAVAELILSEEPDQHDMRRRQ